MKPLEIGLAPWAVDTDGASTALEPLARQAERAEALGFDSLWFPESHFVERGAIPAPLLLLAALAARTRRVRLGTTSYLLPVRHPLQVAEEVAVLDRLSGGRLILGVGRGFRPTLFEAFEVPSNEKRDRFEAALETMRRAWRGEAIGPAGEGSEPIRLAPRPLQQPHPPIWVAAFGPRALAQVGRLGLPYLASPIEPLERLVENYDRHREACPDEVDYDALPVPVIRTVFVTRRTGSLRQVRDALEQQSRTLRASGARWLRRDAEAPVDSWALVGEPAAVADGIERYREKIGLSHLITRAQVPNATPADVERSIEHLAELGEKLR